MPFTGEQKAEWQRQDRKKKAEEKRLRKIAEGFAEVPSSKFGPLPDENFSEITTSLLSQVMKLDAESGGIFYKSEAISYLKLARLYLGLIEEKTDSTLTEAEKKKKKKNVSINPWSSEILGKRRSFDEWLELRDKARKNLFWLGVVVLKKDWVSTTHQVVCDQFVQKDFDGVYHDGYRLQEVHDAIDAQEREKEMILLDPRGFYKSTIDGVDCISWMLNVPDIRILIITGEKGLAKNFMGEVKSYLYLAEGSDPSDFNLLFPDYTLFGVAGRSMSPIKSPARQHYQVAPTMDINSLDSNLSGRHCDIKKGDDVVTDQNCLTPDARQKLKEKYDGTANLTDEWGFTDHIGTRYYTDDWYGTAMQPVTDEEGTAQEQSLRIFTRSCWIVKPGFEKIPLKQLTEEMVTLTFPEKATFKSLRKKLLRNEKSFRNQQLNQPTNAEDDAAFKITFDMDMLMMSRKDRSWEPKLSDPGRTVMAIDTAYTDNKHSDWSVMAVGRVYQLPDKRWALWVTEVVYVRVKSYELAAIIVAFVKKHRPEKITMEQIFGADILKERITQLARDHGIPLPIESRKPDTTSGAKRNRIKSLETLLVENRLTFTAANWNEETFKQFELYKGERSTKTRKDDIPDAISMLCRFIPSSVENVEEKVEQDRQQQKAQRDYINSTIFGGGSNMYTTPPPAPVSEGPRVGRSTPFGIPGLRQRGDA